MMILKDLLLVAKKKYEGWVESGGVTHQVSGCTIPYHDVSRRKGCILSVPNLVARLKPDLMACLRVLMHRVGFLNLIHGVRLRWVIRSV